MTKRILVVEDDADSMTLVDSMLSMAGYDVLRAANAMDAIHIADEDPPDLVLMDIQLPGVNGLEAMRTLKEDPRTEDVKVVALTSRALPGDRGRMLAAGCDGYISKPILSHKDFLGTVASFLSSARSRRHGIEASRAGLTRKSHDMRIIDMREKNDTIEHEDGGRGGNDQDKFSDVAAEDRHSRDMRMLDKQEADRAARDEGNQMTRIGNLMLLLVRGGSGEHLCECASAPGHGNYLIDFGDGACYHNVKTVYFPDDLAGKDAGRRLEGYREDFERHGLDIDDIDLTRIDFDQIGKDLKSEFARSMGYGRDDEERFVENFIPDEICDHAETVVKALKAGKTKRR